MGADVKVVVVVVVLLVLGFVFALPLTSALVVAFVVAFMVVGLLQMVCPSHTYTHPMYEHAANVPHQQQQHDRDYREELAALPLRGGITGIY